MTSANWSILEFAREIIRALDAAEVPYLLGGSLALITWGEVRTTQDVDFAVDLSYSKVPRLSEELMKRDMMVPPDIMYDLIEETRIDLAINAIHPFSGYKAELFPLREKDDLRRTALDRRLLVNLGPVIGDAFVHSAEDLILYKLIYYAISRQTKHARDIASILRRTTAVDYSYIESWAARKEVLDVWQELRSAQP